MKVRDAGGRVFEAQSVRWMCDHRSIHTEDRRAWAMDASREWWPVEVVST